MDVKHLVFACVSIPLLGLCVGVVPQNSVYRFLITLYVPQQL